jgi:hypothetical protein
VTESSPRLELAGAPAHHVVILGCGRSGTSIFGELFQGLGSFTYYSEPPFADLQGYDYSQPIAVKVPNESPGFAPSPGLPFPLPELLRVVPEPRQIYWQVRHPLDAVCSLRIGIAQEWGHHPRPPDWREWLAEPLLDRCAHHWNHLNTVGYAQVRDLATVSRFEEMLATPDLFAQRVSAHVGLDPAEHEKMLVRWARRVQDSNNEHFVEAECSRPYSRPDHEVRLGRWRENLSHSEAVRIFEITGDAAAQFGYEAPD